ncbi:hypothetical protein ABW19_dt0208890 [Dactylella cylindrospora]|nr:hypothetical protein ABW19_dt0208890 [Dactylella cylindrospora]
MAAAAAALVAGTGAAAASVHNMDYVDTGHDDSATNLSKRPTITKCILISIYIAIYVGEAQMWRSNPLLEDDGVFHELGDLEIGTRPRLIRQSLRVCM